MAPQLIAGPLFYAAAIEANAAATNSHAALPVSASLSVKHQKRGIEEMCTSKLELAVLDVLESWRELFNSRELDRLALLYAQHATLHGTSSSLLYQGREQIRSYFTGQSSVEFLSSEISFLADATAIAVGYYVFRVPVGEGVKEVSARFSFVVELGGARPQIVHHHSSLVPL